MRTYYGTIPEPMDWRVHFNDGAGTPKRQLPLYLSEVNHSPDGFAWGYAGSGPAQLAFAILFNYYGRSCARYWYQQFKSAVIAKLDKDKPFELVINEEIALSLDSEPDWSVIFQVKQ